MGTAVRSYSKINLGLAVGPPRGDGFHGLTTLYQTMGLYDVVTVEARRASATKIVLTADHRGVPRTEAGNAERNTAYTMVAGALGRLEVTAEVTVDIRKRLPVQGGMGAGSANAAAALLGLERELGVALDGAARLALASEVGSDVPLFLLGGTVLGLGRGEQVYPMPDLPRTWCVVAVPSVGVSTRLAFAALDRRGEGVAEGLGTRGEGPGGGLARALVAGGGVHPQGLKPGIVVGEHGTAEAVPLQNVMSVSGQKAAALTFAQGVGRLEELSRVLAGVFATSGLEPGPTGIGRTASPAFGSERSFEGATGTAHDLAENALLALVRTGIENDFEEVAFSQHPFLREIKRHLMGTDSGSPALYAALSGSGSALFGLYADRAAAEAAQHRVQSAGTQALLTETLPREAYWRGMFAE